MAMLEEKNIKTYLTDLSKRLKHVNKDLAGIMDSEIDYLSAKIENGIFSELYIGISGFPSAPSLKADIKSMYELSKGYDKKAKKVINKLKSGTVDEQDKLSLKLGSIYVPTKVLEGFIGPKTKKLDDEYSKVSTKAIEETKEGWFAITEQSKQMKNLEEVEGLGISVIRNWDELAGLAGTGAACALLGPLGLAIYPAWMVLKYSKNDRKKHYLFTDIYNVAKQKVKKGKKITEEKIKKSPDATTHEEFKFLHPLIDEELSEPVLLHRNVNGVVSIVDGEYSKLETELKRGVDANKSLMHNLGIISALGGRPNINARGILLKYEHDFKLPDYETLHGFEHEKELAKIMEVLSPKKERVNPMSELIELNDKQIGQIADSLEKYLGDNPYYEKYKVVKPSEAFVDRDGSVYPALPFWVAETEVSSASPMSKYNSTEETVIQKFQELFMEYLKNDSHIPLTTFVKDPEVTDRVMKKLKDSPIPAMYVFADRAQFRLVPPEMAYKKLYPKMDETTSKAINLKQNLTDRIENLAKKAHYKTLFDDLSMIELEKVDSTSGYHGSLKDLADLYHEVNLKIDDLEKNVEAHKYSQAEIQEKTNEIALLQKKLTQTYGKLTPNALEDLKGLTTEKTDNKKLKKSRRKRR